MALREKFRQPVADSDRDTIFSNILGIDGSKLDEKNRNHAHVKLESNRLRTIHAVSQVHSFQRYCFTSLKKTYCTFPIALQGRAEFPPFGVGAMKFWFHLFRTKEKKYKKQIRMPCGNLRRMTFNCSNDRLSQPGRHRRGSVL